MFLGVLDSISSPIYDKCCKLQFVVVIYKAIYCTTCQPQRIGLECIGKKNLRILGQEKKNMANIVLSGQFKCCINCTDLLQNYDSITTKHVVFWTLPLKIEVYHFTIEG